MTHHIWKYRDSSNFSRGQFYYAAIIDLKFVGTWAPTYKIIAINWGHSWCYCTKYPHFPALP